MEILQANTGKLGAQLAHWGTKLDELVAKAAELGEDAKHESRKRIDELEAKHSMARAKLDEHELVGSEQWELFKGRVESAWRELEVALGKLKS